MLESQTGAGRESQPGRLNNRPPHLNGVIYWSNQAAFHLGHGHHCSHCNNRMGAVWHAILQHNINLSVPRQGDHNELPAKVAKRAERAQLLVLYNTIAN